MSPFRETRDVLRTSLHRTHVWRSVAYEEGQLGDKGMAPGSSVRAREYSLRTVLAAV